MQFGLFKMMRLAYLDTIDDSYTNSISWLKRVRRENIGLYTLFRQHICPNVFHIYFTNPRLSCHSFFFLRDPVSRGTLQTKLTPKLSFAHRLLFIQEKSRKKQENGEIMGQRE